MPAIPEGLPTIGKATLILLRQHGVDDAFAVITADDDKRQAVPGVGPAKWAVLDHWARTAMDLGDRVRIIELYEAELPTTDMKLLGVDEDRIPRNSREEIQTMFNNWGIRDKLNAIPIDQRAKWRSIAWYESVALPRWLSTTVHADWFSESDTLTAQDQEILQRRFGEGRRLAVRIVNEAADRLDSLIERFDAEAAANKARDKMLGIVIYSIVLAGLAGGAWWLFGLFGRHH